MNKGVLFVISAPSGCGKGSVLSLVTETNSNIHYSVSATTRKPREGEVNGVNYHFIKKEDFEALIQGGNMLEYAEYCGNYYGTPARPVKDMLNSGKHVMLEIEVQGAMKVKEKCPDAALIFVVPPSLDELKRRLLKRGTETEEVIAQRLAQAENEMRAAKEYDYIIVNENLETAAEDLKTVIRAEELRNRGCI
ncbi:MAG: guanylate kinase [Oscillospiraceae bacterium]|nr:guanylate kinase [Oscillospiraceae bacterium]